MEDIFSCFQKPFSSVFTFPSSVCDTFEARTDIPPPTPPCMAEMDPNYQHLQNTLQKRMQNNNALGFLMDAR